MGSGDTGAGREWWGDGGNLIVDFKGIYSLEKEAENRYINNYKLYLLCKKTNLKLRYGRVE